MSADNRSVATDALATLGTIIDEKAGRDAIHLAVEPAVAGMTLRPGEDIGFLDDGTAGIVDKPLGIVDPFLKAAVKKGQRFWFIVYPRQITSLRHVWVHPDFSPVAGQADTPNKATSEKWLRDFVDQSDCPKYEEVIALAMKHARDGGEYDNEYILVHGSDAHGQIPSEFWDHLEVVTGVKAKYRANYFSCSC